MTVGADRGAVARLVLGETRRLVAVGLTGGLAAAWFLRRRPARTIEGPPGPRRALARRIRRRPRSRTHRTARVFADLAGSMEKWQRRKAELMAGGRWVELLY